MYVVDGSPLQLGMMDEKREVVDIERDIGPCVDGSVDGSAVKRCEALGTGSGFSESLFGRRNSAVMLTPHQWVAVWSRNGQMTARLGSTRETERDDSLLLPRLDSPQRPRWEERRRKREGQSREAARSLARRRNDEGSIRQ